MASRILVLARSLGTNWVFELIGTWLVLDLGGLDTMGFGIGLDNIVKLRSRSG